MVRNSSQISDQPGAIKCARARCKTCLFIHSMEKISGPSDLSRLLITLRIPPPMFTSWETRRRLSDRFREHLRYVERKGKHASKPVAKHFNLPILSLEHMAVFGLSLQLGNSESLEHKFIFQIGSLNPTGINERFSFNLSILVFLVTMFLPTALLHLLHTNIHIPKFIHLFWGKPHARNVSLETLRWLINIINSVEETKSTRIKLYSSHFHEWQFNTGSTVLCLLKGTRLNAVNLYNRREFLKMTFRALAHLTLDG